MKVLIVVDVSWWAIGKLSAAIVKHNPHINFKIFEWPPRELETKRAEFEQILSEFNPDLVHFQYWRTCDFALSTIQALNRFKKILTHHNQKNLLHGDWKSLDAVVCHTQKANDILVNGGANKNVLIIQHGIDLSHFTYADELPKEKRIGYVGRMVPWKGFKEVVRAAKELNTRFIAMVGGRIEKPNYINEIKEQVGDPEQYGEIMFSIPDENRVDMFRKMSVYVGNSGDNHEEGPLGLLEAMASGVPVVTTPAGEANDLIKDGVNGFLVPFGDYEALKAKIAHVLSMDGKELDAIRYQAWNTVKNMPEEKMAYLYQRIYQTVVYNSEPLVSVVIPTYNRLENVAKILESLERQTHKAIEVVICDDGSTDGTKEFIEQNRYLYPFAIKYVHTQREDGYNLARARNLGVVEATGEYILFLDSRFVPKPDAVFMLLQEVSSSQKMWVFGKKGGADKKNFVENFSMIRRDEFIRAGMCNEQIDRYGGMSQELRERFQAQGFILKYVPEAGAEILNKTSKTADRRADIIAMKQKLFKMGL